MCGIAGVVFKDKNLHPVGRFMTRMLDALQHRGPDSAGFALYGGLGLREHEYLLNIEVKEKPGLLEEVKTRVNTAFPIESEEIIPSVENYLIYRCKVVLDSFSQLKPLIMDVDKIEDVIVLNGAHSFEMIKDVGLVNEIAARYNTEDKMGTHAIGHTRFSTESIVDRYHAHPFQSYIIPDITVVHNGQITNYWKIRDPLERKGHIFETNNDTECIVHYIADKLSQNYSLEEALEQSVKDMDGPFSYIVGTPNGVGIAKDQLGLRPGVMAENDEVFAIASEEVALREVMDTSDIEQISPGETRAYTI
ncbi:MULTISPECIES: glutamine amidotransferase [Methanobacterium]|uniref:Glutamine amidotransferase n=1 Tax=Methanobacterium formicicum TaxID=2162 RepID=A0A090JU62_METFO|nr:MULTISPECIES: glutamine amidotransferase [Methanobacterium]AIS31471.1 glutamine amidotransferase [Methanobacterium formicicum]KUK74906.1 MAG: Glutamine amidotransferase class-ii [Methanobacterium sp. 42_16]MBF4475703.1 glutamine amidotransferase [Methanobacterium formicicum]MDD4810489.1 glutamine amidotransferase [Methanobacterium formicicum]MDH2658434.1 glutamine amidotransferase [Methanobacterium formicicum]